LNCEEGFAWAKHSFCPSTQQYQTLNYCDMLEANSTVVM